MLINRHEQLKAEKICAKLVMPIYNLVVGFTKESVKLIVGV